MPTLGGDHESSESGKDFHSGPEVLEPEILEGLTAIREQPFSNQPIDLGQARSSMVMAIFNLLMACE